MLDFERGYWAKQSEEQDEGGASTADDPHSFAEGALEALRLCYFDPQTGDDQRHAPGAKEDCEAACYGCLMSYYNQMDHRLLDRQSIKGILMELATSTALVSPQVISRAEHLQRLRNLCQSDLEKSCLDFLEQRNYSLPSHAQKLIDACHTRPDFLYEKNCAAIYVDGYHHLFEERRQRDHAQTECMEDMGYTVIRFGVLDDWDKVFHKYQHIFGDTVKEIL
jgi:very-short-patch-repair endonuclease